MVDTDGLEVYLVGGAVRDQYLGQQPNDRDYVVVGATPEEMRERGFNTPVGDAFAVFIHPETGDEWALARTEESTGDSYKDFNVNADASVSLAEDLYRRDLTINAMAVNPKKNETIDPYGGLDDLENQVLRHISPAFAEDPLRVLRVAAFAARLPEFEVHPETAALCEDLTPKLETIAPQRIREELIKMFQKAEAPRRFFDTLRDFNALSTVFPTLADLTEVPAGPDKYHQEGTAYEHTMRVLTEAHKLQPDNERLLWAALGHDFGKRHTNPEDLPNHPLHEKYGPNAVEEFAENITLDNTRRRVMSDAARFHMRFHRLTDLRESTLITMVERLGEPNLTIREFIDLGVADSLGREPPKVQVTRETARKHLDAAQETVDKFGGREAFDKFDLSQSAGEKIGALILQERVRHLKNARPEA